MFDPDDFFARTGIALADSETLDVGHITRDIFDQWRAPRRGNENPECQTNPLWEWLVRTGINAYQATKKFGGPSPFDAGSAWCFERLGQPVVTLPDGTRVFIAGEHEDHYDPDFYIYNDVTLWRSDGRVEIMGYPEECLPPTDFHTATLVNDFIILIGNLGHPEHRKTNDTQVVRINVKTWQAEVIKTIGDKPNWLHRHKASLVEGRGTVIVSHGHVGTGDEDAPLMENFDRWELDLATWTWTKVWTCLWPRYRIQRTDGASLNLWSMTMALSPDYTSSIDFEALGPLQLDPASLDLIRQQSASRRQEAAQWHEQGITLELLTDLFSPAIEHTKVDDSEDFGDEYAFKVKRVRVGGVIVRYLDDDDSIQMTVEGDLSPSSVAQLVEDLRVKLEVIQGFPCETKEV